MDLDLTDAQTSFEAELTAFAGEHVAPQAARIDETGEFPAALVADAAARGYLGLLVPREWGGRGVDQVSYALAIEAIARASATLAVILAVHNSLVADVIVRLGSDAQRERWLRPLAAGRVLGAFALSEADAGTDAANQQTTARREPGGYRLTGRKVWVANGVAAGMALVFAATRPGARGRGISAFLVPIDREGIRRTRRGLARRPRSGLRGPRAADVWAAEDERVGAEHEGFPPWRATRSTWGGWPSRRRRSAWDRPRWTKRWRTPGRGIRSDGPSPSTRRCSGFSPTWPPSSRPRGC